MDSLPFTLNSSGAFPVVGGMYFDTIDDFWAYENKYDSMFVMIKSTGQAYKYKDGELKQIFDEDFLNERFDRIEEFLGLVTTLVDPASFPADPNIDFDITVQTEVTISTEYSTDNVLTATINPTNIPDGTPYALAISNKKDLVEVGVSPSPVTKYFFGQGAKEATFQLITDGSAVENDYVVNVRGIAPGKTKEKACIIHIKESAISALKSKIPSLPDTNINATGRAITALKSDISEGGTTFKIWDEIDMLHLFQNVEGDYQNSMLAMKVNLKKVFYDMTIGPNFGVSTVPSNGKMEGIKSTQRDVLTSQMTSMVQTEKFAMSDGCAFWIYKDRTTGTAYMVTRDDIIPRYQRQSNGRVVNSMQTSSYIAASSGRILAGSDFFTCEGNSNKVYVDTGNTPILNASGITRAPFIQNTVYIDPGFVFLGWGIGSSKFSYPSVRSSLLGILHSFWDSVNVDYHTI